MRLAVLIVLMLFGRLVGAEPPDAPWQRAVALNHIGVIESLYADIGDVDLATEHGKTALMAAAGAGHVELMDRLLAAGADPDARNHLNGTVLMFAAGSGSLAAVERLLDRVIAVDTQASNGWTALMMATAKNHGEVVNRLATAGADPNQADIYGWTPLMRAAFDGHADAFAALLTLPEVNLEATNRNGQTALHLAVIAERSALVRALIEAGASQTEDHNGYTPQGIAAELARPDLQGLLEEKAGAD